MNDERLETIKEVKQFLVGSEALDAESQGAGDIGSRQPSDLVRHNYTTVL